MTKKEYRALTEKYNMNMLTEEITGQNWGYYLDTDHYIDELDALADRDGLHNVMVERIAALDGDKVVNIRYKLVPPSDWFDLWGLKD